MKKNYQDVGKPAESNLCVHCIAEKHFKDNCFMYYSLIKSFGSVLQDHEGKGMFFYGINHK